MIKPTIGRVVWYWPSNRTQPEQPLAAIIAHVWTDHCVNLAYFDQNGVAKNATSVPLHQGESERPSHTYCEWMPYQKGQAARADAANAAAANVTGVA